MAKLKLGRYAVLHADGSRCKPLVTVNEREAVRYASLVSALTGKEFFVCRVEAYVGPPDGYKESKPRKDRR